MEVGDDCRNMDPMPCRIKLKLGLGVREQEEEVGKVHEN